MQASEGGPTAIWWELYGNGTVAGLALLGLIVIAIVFAAQLEALFSACRQLLAHRHQAVMARKRLEADVVSTQESLQSLNDSLPELRREIEELVSDFERLDAQAGEARMLHIREIVMTDIFVQASDRPFLANIRRPKAGADEPFADQWRTGRDHVLYAADKRAAAIRFAQRYPAEHGFAVGPVAPFVVPWNPREESPPDLPH